MFFRGKKGFQALVKGVDTWLDTFLIVHKKEKKKNYSRTTRQYMEAKLNVCVWLLGFVFIVLSIIVAYKTMSDTDAANIKINSNYNYSTTEIVAPRGDILDANGTILVTSTPKYLMILEPGNILSEAENSKEAREYRDSLPEERVLSEIVMMEVFKNILDMDEIAMDQAIREICVAAKKVNNKVTDDPKEEQKAKHRLYYRYYEEGNDQESATVRKTYISSEKVEKIKELTEKLRSKDSKDKKEAVCELFGIKSEKITEIEADYQTELNKDAGFFKKLWRKITNEKVEIDYEAIAKKHDGLTADEVRAIVKWKNLRIVGIWFETEYDRVYPNDTLACKLLGFYAQYNPSSSMGLEQYYDEYLTGKNGIRKGYINSDYNLEYVNQAEEKGNTLVTTIDMRIQKIVEEQIQKFNDEIGAESIGVVCMNPQNGSIYAMADDRIYNPNQPSQLDAYYTDAQLNQMWERILEENAKLYEDGKAHIEEELNAIESETERENAKKSILLNYIYRNFCISDTYEPGSTFKPLTIAMAYEEGLVNANSTFVCDGSEQIGSSIIHCHNQQGCGCLDLTGALTNSCNDYLMHISSLIGKERFYDYRCRFGIGSKTNIDLPGEVSASALNYDLAHLDNLALAISSFGQGFNVTMLQMAAASCAMINGGYYYTPHVVSEIRSADNTVVSRPNAEPVTQIISSTTSEFLRGALFQTVEAGTASYVRISGYHIGGKTGTAQKTDRNSGNYVISLASFAPVEDPQMFMYVVVNQPHLEEQNSSKWAQILSKRIWMEVLPYLNIHSYNEGVDYIQPEESGDDPDVIFDGYEAGGYITSLEP